MGLNLRNKPCRCGSGKKTKKCCGDIRKPFLSPKTVKVNKIDFDKWYKIGKKTLKDNYHPLVKKILSKPNMSGKYSKGDSFIKLGDEYFEYYKQELSEFTSMFFNGCFVMSVDEDSDTIERLLDEEKNNHLKDSFVQVSQVIHPSNIKKVSKRKVKRILNSLINHHLTLNRVYDDLKKTQMEGETLIDMRTQTIDIHRTNIWSCFDDFTYGFLEWLLEDKGLIIECVGVSLYSLMVSSLYRKLGNPNNRLERESGVIEDLLNIIQNNDDMMYHFRMTRSGIKVNHVVKSKVRNSWINNNPELGKFYNNSTCKWIIENQLIYRCSTNKGLYEDVNSLSYDLKVNQNQSTPEIDITWIEELGEDDMVTIYRSVSDKEHPIGWSWTIDKMLGLKWIRGRGLVEDSQKTKSYIVETQIPKKDILRITSVHYDDEMGVDNYSELVVTKDKLKNCELKITEIDSNDHDSLFNLLMSDIVLKKLFIHQEIVETISTISKNIMVFPPFVNQSLNVDSFIEQTFLGWSENLTQESCGNYFDTISKTFQPIKKVS